MASADPAVVERARKIVALNYKLLVHAGYESELSTNKTITVHPNLQYVGKELSAGPVDFNNPDNIRRILDRSPRANRTDAEGRRAAAQLIARFGEAADRYLTGPDQVAAVEYGMRIIVLNELEWLFNAGSRPVEDINHVLGITVDEIIDAFRDFQTIPRLDAANAKFIPVVDYLDYSYSRSPGVGVAYLLANDVETSFSAYTNPSAFTVIGVRVPSQFRSRLATTLTSEGQIKIDQTKSQTGLVWFEYQTRDSSGGMSWTRAYLYQRP